jgi:hypothetical protein
VSQTGCGPLLLCQEQDTISKEMLVIPVASLLQILLSVRQPLPQSHRLRHDLVPRLDRRMPLGLKALAAACPVVISRRNNFGLLEARWMTMYIRNRCHDFKNIFFPKKIGEKWRFWLETKAKLWKKLIVTLAFEKNAKIFAENWRKSQKIVIITSTPGTMVQCRGFSLLESSTYVVGTAQQN